MSKNIWIYTILLILIIIPALAAAESIISADIVQMDASGFPRISGYLDVKGEGGAFFYDLKNPNLTILEDGNRVPVDELVAAKPGTQFVIAISPASAFNIRDSLGNTRYDYMLNTINTWAEILAPTANDSISLVTPGGNLLNGSEDPAELIQMLQTFEPNYDNTTANLDVLSRAVDLAADTPPRTGMGRVVLFLTAAPTDDTIDVIRGISDRALTQDVRVMVWLLDSSANFETEASLALRELAELSGGIFYPFSGVEALPEIDTYLEPLRYVYKFAYQSTITSAGAFPISIEIQYEETTITTDSYDIEVLVQAPNPIFIDPPEEINRTFDVEYGNQTENLVPAQKQIEILIEFNDDVQRNVVRSSMYINEELAAENLSSPFNAFTWDLKEITESGVYSIRFEVEDEFGLVGSSLPSEINVVVEETPNDLRVFIDRYGTGLIFLLAALIGGFFVLALFISGRFTPKSIAEKSLQRKRKSDPVTQPIGSRFNPQPFRFPKAGEKEKTRLSRKVRGSDHQLAVLTAIAENGNGTLVNRLIINQEEMIIGSDPEKANLLLEDSSIHPGHARIEAENQTDFLIYDMGSDAGTYVNYQPVDQNGTRIEHLDIVHFGCFGFCFEVKNPATIKDIKINLI